MPNPPKDDQYSEEETKIHTLTAATTAAAAANAFVQFAREEQQNLDQMKLQKLLFYAHAWHLAIKGQPLFEEDFVAWPWGPVVRNIYTQTVGLGRGSVLDQEFVELQKIGELGHMLDFNFVRPDPPSSETLSFLRDVWEAHKHFTGVQLSNSTHAPGEPWAIVKQRYGKLDSKPTIPNDLIRDVFKKKLDDAPPNSAP